MEFEINIATIFQIVTLLVLIFGIVRGIITKGDCKECKTGINTELTKGNDKFDVIDKTLAAQGAQLTMIVDSVGMLVEHHIDKD